MNAADDSTFARLVGRLGKAGKRSGVARHVIGALCETGARAEDRRQDGAGRTAKGTVPRGVRGEVRSVPEGSPVRIGGVRRVDLAGARVADSRDRPPVI